MLSLVQKALLDVAAYDKEAGLVQGGACGENLRDDGFALPLVHNHPLDAANLAFDAAQPAKDFVLLGGAFVCHTVTHS